MDSENSQPAKILSRLAPKDFVGRDFESDKLLGCARKESGGLLLFGAPKSGASELLRQTYDRIWREPGTMIPFYFAVSRTDKTVKNCARRFLRDFLLQTTAFRGADTKPFDYAPGIFELAAAASDDWIKLLAAACERENESDDESSFVKICLSAPLRAARHDARAFVMIDDLHNAESLSGETDLAETLKEIYARADLPFVFAGRRRFVLTNARSGSRTLPDAETLHLDSLSTADAKRLVENLSSKYAVETNDSAGDLIVRQFDSNLLFIESIFIAAARRKIHLDSFLSVQQIYADELFGGAIGKFYDAQLDEAAPDFNVRKRIVNLLHSARASGGVKIKSETAIDSLKISGTNFCRIARELHTREIVNYNSDAIEFAGGNTILSDYIEARYRLENSGEPRALVVGDCLAKFLGRASPLLARVYRRSAALDLRRLLTVFDCQSVPASLLDYRKFKAEHRGAAEDEIAENLNREDERIVLPHIVYAANCQAFYPPLAQISDEERAIVATGFEAGDYRKENEIAWIAAEIDSKLEASKHLAEFWCDRLEMAALACNFSKFRLWLVAPEGFAPDALEVLRDRNAYGSSREQCKFLAEHLKAESANTEKTDANEYEMIVPMGGEAEMIAARAVEEIARRHGFPPKAVTQIKTALVEACINAAEHSLSPDRRIYQKFTVEKDRIIIAVSNRGVKIPPAEIAGITAPIEPNGRRGWGLKLMRTLMDEVKFERTDDGTRISMVKYLNGNS